MLCKLTLLTTACIGFSVGVSQARADDGKELQAKAKKLFGVLEPVPEDRLNSAEVKLGRSLFWDQRASADGKTSCASCHLPSDWGADRRTASRRATGSLTKRNSQTVFNAMGQSGLRWTADRKTGAIQAQGSLTGSLGMPSADAGLAKLRELGYEQLFAKAYPDAKDPLTLENYGKAIEAYEATLVTPAPFDNYLAGDEAALNAQQQAGLQAFISTGCADCHNGPLLGGGELAKFGIEKDYWLATGSKPVDTGRFGSTNDEADRYVFRVAQLRNIAKTGPYFHDGSVKQLDKAVAVMGEVQLGKRLSDKEVADLVAFLESLTGDVPKQFAPPAEFPGQPQ